MSIKYPDASDFRDLSIENVPTDNDLHWAQSLGIASDELLGRTRKEIRALIEERQHLILVEEVAKITGLESQAVTKRFPRISLLKKYLYSHRDRNRQLQRAEVLQQCLEKFPVGTNVQCDGSRGNVVSGRITSYYGENCVVESIVPVDKTKRGTQRKHTLSQGRLLEKARILGPEEIANIAGGIG